MFPLSPHKPERNTSVASTFPMPTLPTKSTQPNHNQFKQKTSAETINETKRMLANGVRLVSTRRPITPREPRRQLYGKISLADRPPSAFSLSYLQVENRVLPPIPCRSPKPNNNTVNNVPTSIVGSKTISNNVVASNGQQQHQQLQHTLHALDHRSNKSIGNSNNTNDLRENNAINANNCNCIGEKSDNNLNIGAVSAINFNIETKANRCMGQPKLPTLSNDSKIAISANSSDNVSTSNVANNKTMRFDNRIFDSDNIKNTSSATMSIDDIFEHDEQIALPMADEANQSSVKKQPISEQRKLLLLRGNDLLAQSSTETLLDMLKSHSGIKDCSDETVLHINGILIELYARVKDIQCDRRSSILSSLYGLVECTSAKILLSVARVVLALCVTGSNLTGACKLVFKVARNERNDYLFANVDVPEHLIDGLGRASPIEDAEACIYGYGAVRFLANAEIPLITSGNRNSSSSSSSTNTPVKKSKTLACRLIRHGALPLMILHLQMINEAGAIAKLQSSSLHALYQLCSALRVLSKILMSDYDLKKIISENLKQSNGERRSSKTKELLHLALESSTDFDVQVVQAGSHLIRSAEISIDQIEVQFSIIRTLSVLSEHDSCCNAISDMSPRLGILLGPILIALPNQKHNQQNNSTEAMSTATAFMSNKSLGLLNRIGYILGNIMSKSDSARQCFYNNDVALEYLLKTLEYYANDELMFKRIKSALINDDIRCDADEITATTNECQIDTVIDVVIKLIRVVANLSVNAEVGYKLANFHQLGTILLTILNTINKYHMNFTLEFEELLLATLGAIHNLSFYQNGIQNQSVLADNPIKYHPNSMIEQMAAISATLCEIYKWTTEPIQCEIARVLGNLTRSLDARAAVHSAGGLKFLVKNLSSSDADIVGTSCGVLVNMLSDWERRAQFRELNGPLLLRMVLQSSTLKQDWLLALIACQALWNYIIDSGNVIGALGEEEADYISADILEYLDEEKLFENAQPDADWEAFAIVAADLLERIQSSLSYNNSAYASSADDDDDDDDEIVHSQVINMSKTRFKSWLANS